MSDGLIRADRRAVPGRDAQVVQDRRQRSHAQLDPRAHPQPSAHPVFRGARQHPVARLVVTARPVRPRTLGLSQAWQHCRQWPRQLRVPVQFRGPRVRGYAVLARLCADATVRGYDACRESLQQRNVWLEEQSALVPSGLWLTRAVKAAGGKVPPNVGADDGAGSDSEDEKPKRRKKSRF